MLNNEKLILLNLFEKYNSDPAVEAGRSGQEVTVDALVAISKAAAISEAMQKLGIIPALAKYESRCSQL